ncbi:MAG TPA: EF-P lysine aminoacylase EpmA [Smithella sp.]|nr:EF-P lysine aminoacylase GenX [Smithella sp.]MDM7986691.1 EF-P lysine aminoacylase EpmA [Smithella sp.]HNY51115.1 EF-P lysine aminoacylase EpmA [Smithella sp.]HOG90652.1 EF-P lysine aminoacylase EpmA [Smithella sp.]HOU49972.1 EF-P lysine aminoacylase EpmA [Smithella sp.]
MPESFSDNNFFLARKFQNLETRASFIQNIRLFFIQNGFLEVETPVRIPAPAPEEHIEAIRTDGWFLQTSPELCMKRLLAAGYPRIFQISKCFRADERGDKHLPEFTMLEWYVTGFDYQQLMNQCEAMILSIATASGVEAVNRQNKKISLLPPWERITVGESFLRYAPVTSDEAMAKGIFDEILVDNVEPQLGIIRPTFLYDYPAKLAALAKLKDSNPAVSERFELYIDGLEIANGFSELINPREQRERFEEALKARAAKNWARYAMPEKFLQSLTNLPPCAGIALGIDRLIMVLTGAKTIDDVVAFTPENL